MVARRASTAYTDHYGAAFQVETVGDKYMAVSGLPTRCSSHAVNIANLALNMIDIVQEVNAGGKKMQVRFIRHFTFVRTGLAASSIISQTECTNLNDSLCATFWNCFCALLRVQKKLVLQLCHSGNL